MTRLVLLSIIIVSMMIGTTSAQLTTWVEDGEHGLASIIDRTATSYSLLQSEIVAQGQLAFHLANPGFEDNWFELLPSIAVQPDSQLFFASRLGTATSDQIATVQLSADNGASWPTTLFTQPGNGFPGEANFNLQAISLAPFAGQDVRLRFLLDFQSPGSAFNQTDPDVGWIIDDIRIDREYEKNAYNFGNPTPEATLYLELINRARADASAEATRLAQSTDADVQRAKQSFGITASDIQQHFAWDIDQGCIADVSQPLAFSATLLNMATLHSQDQRDNGFQGHVSSANPPAPFQPGDGLGERAQRVGYSYFSLGENVFRSATSVEYGHAAFEIDWGAASSPSSACYNPSFAGDNMQNPAGHRANIHNDVFKEIGVGIANTGGAQHVVTQDLGTAGAGSFATGVVFDDLDGDGFYDLGEGVGGVRVDSDASAFYALTSPSGAYTLPLSDNGAQQLQFSIDGYSPADVAVHVVGDRNVKANFRLQDLRNVPGDFNADGVLDVADLNELTQAIRTQSSETRFDVNDDGQVTDGDRTFWVHDLKHTYFGDANLDGLFDTSDLIVVFQSGHYEDQIAANSTWLQGDFTGDSEFDTQDVILAFQDGGFEQGPRAANAVPEPTSLVLGAIAFMGTVWRRKGISIFDIRYSPFDIRYSNLERGRQMNVRTMTSAVTIALLTWFASGGMCAERPNIVFIMADDLGWADVGFHAAGPDSLAMTPTLDALAKTSLELTQHYVAPVCSPTRTALLSGRCWSRFNVTSPQNELAMPFGTTTLASALKRVGYRTGLTGKWHLGSLPEQGPNHFGFDHSYGSLAGGVSPWNHRYKQGPFTLTWHRNETRLDETGHVTDLITAEAIRFIEAGEQPFFLYVPFTAVHLPLKEPQEWLDRVPAHITGEVRRHYAASILHLDDSVKRIRDALAQQQILENTVLVFTSDNGGSTAENNDLKYPDDNCPNGRLPGDNRPLRGQKGQLYEGGTRVPTLVSWPARVRPGVNPTPVQIIDWMPTFCALAGFASDYDLQWDGVDLSPLLLQDAKLAERSIYAVAPGWRARSLRRGDWKLIVHADQKPAVELFNLATDPAESVNLASEQEAIVTKLQAELTKFVESDPPTHE
ncbi:MAG: sulfatase-like hydrolase/transferase [Planctomycetales bacterium]|nr:sulfatase-like hydrolase/transferase [Planctomycetales bacterium]